MAASRFCWIILLLDFASFCRRRVDCVLLRLPELLARVLQRGMALSGRLEREASTTRILSQSSRDWVTEKLHLF